MHIYIHIHIHTCTCTECGSTQGSDTTDDDDTLANGVGDGETPSEGNTKEPCMAWNPQGQAELKGFESLEFVLEFIGNSIRQGIDGYQTSQLCGKGLKEYVKGYGLVQTGRDL